MKFIFISVVLLVNGIFFSFHTEAQKNKTPGYIFKDLNRHPVTQVKNQDKTGTCWAWSGTSFLEAEIARKGGKLIELSPMAIVHNAYLDKCEKFVRMHGAMPFRQGGSLYDVINLVRKYGIVPYSMYSGLNYGGNIHKHAELEASLKAYLEVIVKNSNGILNGFWMSNCKTILDNYLGEFPEKLEVDGKSYTPQEYVTEVARLNMDDYVSITSFTHHPFYTQFPLEIPDNWGWFTSYNVPLDDFMEIADYAVNNGFTIGWAADISEPNFVQSQGIASMPMLDTLAMSLQEKSKWNTMSVSAKFRKLISSAHKQMNISQEMRQKGFDNYQTTDDHGMHIIGNAVDQLGNKYFIVKNSWGDYGDYKGYHYVSYAYFAYKTMNILVHKDALPKIIRKKLGIR